MAIFNLPHERLTFNNWAPVQGQFPSFFFFLIFPLDQIEIEPLNFSAIYKPVISFQFNQFNP
jgi:hypothetical protein